MSELKFYEKRLNGTGKPRQGDVRTPYQRDRARLLHSSAFRRLQGKTQVMGAGEGDFHRTRLTHSIECAQIGNGLLETIARKRNLPEELVFWLPERDLIEASCFAHDLGHPPFGHGGEIALHVRMSKCGGFEGNGQTLRILSRLEKYREKGWGIDPTRRLVLAVLKYPVPYSAFDVTKYAFRPPKCFFDEERDVVDWALSGFDQADRNNFQRRNEKDKPAHRSFDSSLMELADDIAYGVHDIEDIRSRRLAEPDEITLAVLSAFRVAGGKLKSHDEIVHGKDIVRNLLGTSYERKQAISQLVNVFVSNVTFATKAEFHHPLLRFQTALPDPLGAVLGKLKDIALELVVSRPQVRQLEKRGQMIVDQLFEALSAEPEHLIHSWADADDDVCASRRVCDYIAGMTDSYAEKVYRRLFVPGFGSSTDEL